MAALIGLIAGALIGGSIMGGAGTAVGGIIGFFIGAIMASRRERAAHLRPDIAGTTATSAPASTAGEVLAQRVVMLEQRVDELERSLRSRDMAVTRADAAADTASKAAAPAVQHVTLPPVTTSFDSPEPTTPESFVPGADGTLPAPVASGADGASISVPPPMPAADATTGVAAIAAAAAAATRRAPAAPVAPNPLWAWLVGGNTLARLGVVLLFIGVGFLLKYAVEHVHVPITVRLAGVALGGVALLVVGWRLRVRRRAYAMVLQGGGVGVLYLTVFAALRLYELVPPVAAFVLLLWISALSSWLAVRQDAISLAALAVAGGFLAPILTSSQTGNHVVLFGYYTLLNAGILGIAWFKAWRSLNLLGFVFTFLVGTFWGVTRYRPEHFGTTEPFLILFFLFYVAIAVLYALRRSVALRNYVDAGLVFGTPLVAAGLQSALVRDIEYGMAYSALAMSAVYLALGKLLWKRRRDDIRLLVESFLALGVVFATLAIPLGLDARWTSAAWALEGAAMVWAGVRQQRAVLRAFGLLLQLGAGVAFGLGLSLWAPSSAPATIPLVNSAYVGAVLVALAGLYSAWLLQREHDRLPGLEQGFAALVFAWGALWWVFAGWREIERWVPADTRLPVAIGLLAATAVAFAVAEWRLRWPIARIPALVLLPALLAIAVIAIARDGFDANRLEHLLAHGGFVAWPLAVAVVAGLLHRFDRYDVKAGEGAAVSLDLWHAGLFWLVLLLTAHELGWLGSRTAFGHGIWAAAPWGLVPALGVAAVCALAAGSTWPIGVHRRAYLVAGAIPVIALLIFWSLAVNVRGDGNPAPLPFVPLVNPLDLTQALVLVAGATWVMRVRRDDAGVFIGFPPGAVVAVFSALLFLWINALVLRTIHFWYDVSYTPHALWHSTLVQAVLSLLWSILALATMVYANRRRWRTSWMAGAVLLGIVVAKLFAVELAQVGTITRIVSFIGVGLLLLLIGYLAPVPPRRTEDAS